MVKGKLLVGPILAILGGVIMVISAYFVYASIAITEAGLVTAGLSWQDVGFNPMLFYVRVACTALWGLLGIIGAILGFKGKKIGGILAILGGILGIIGMIVPIGTITIVLSVPVSLSSSFVFVEPSLMLIGGILGLILKE